MKSLCIVLTKEGRELIKNKRIEKFGSQNDASLELGIPQINVSRWESGKVSPRYFPFRSYLTKLDLQPGFLGNKKYVAKTKHSGFKIKKVKREKMSKELAYILGVVGPGDGWVTSNGYAIGLNSIDKDFVDYFQFCMEKVFGLECKRYKRVVKPSKLIKTSSKQYTVLLFSKSAVESLKKFNVPFKEKIWRIPEKIKESTNGYKSMYLKGIFDSQATVVYSGVTRAIYMQIINPKGIKEVQSLLKDLGVNSVIHSNTIKLHIIGKKNLSLYYDKIGFTIERKKEKLKSASLSFKQDPISREKIIELLPKMISLKNSGFSYRKVAREVDLNKSTVINNLRKVGCNE